MPPIRLETTKERPFGLWNGFFPALFSLGLWLRISTNILEKGIYLSTDTALLR